MRSVQVRSSLGGVKPAPVVVLACVVLMAGCGGSRRSILSKGLGPAPGSQRFTVTDASARLDARNMRARWERDITRRGRDAPTEQFANLPVQLFMQRLRTAAAHYRFTVKTAEFLKPRESAPLVVIQTRDYLGLARAIRLVEKSLDPHTGGNDLTGWAFEGFYLEAQDERGVPFAVVANALRGPHAYGSQWARSEELFPFPHG
jgi:hypothetical protein